MKGRAMADNLPPDLTQKPHTPKQEKPEGSLHKFRQWLIDSYNGIFKIIIQPQLPSARVMGFMTLAFLLGMLWAYNIVPAKFYNAAPYQLSEAQRDQYIKLIAGSYQAELYYGDDQVIQLLRRVENPAEAVQRLMQAEAGNNLQLALQRIFPLAQQAEPGTVAPKAGGITGDIFSLIIAVVVFLAVVNLFAIAWGLLIGGYVERTWERIRPKSEEDRRRDAEAKKVRADIERRRMIQEEMQREAAVAVVGELGPPLITKPSIYTKGRAYDDSFAIEDANDMFLGECGATIAKTVGESQELAAVEVWLFDKDDFVRTFTKLFVSEHAYNDPVTRSELEPKVEDPTTDLVLLRPGATIVLESAKIRVQARVVDVTPGTSPDLPPNSHFEGLTLQMQAWQKVGEVVAVPAAPVARAGQRLHDSYEIGPPPPMPSEAAAPTQPTTPPAIKAPPSSSGQRPLDSYEIGPPPTERRAGPLPPTPPMRPPGTAQPRREEEDPFGGTGDFTPLPRD